MVAVVATAGREDNLSWITQRMPLQTITTPSPREIGESRPWLQWIVDNYDHLPDYVFFSHGHQVSWHCSHNIDKIVELAKPGLHVHMLAICSNEPVSNDAQLLQTFIAGSPIQEAPLDDYLARALFNMSYQTIVGRWHMEKYACCSENIVSSEAIRTHTKDVYLEIIKTIDQFDGGSWGWAFERTWFNLWSPHEDVTLTSSDVISNLISGREPLKVAVKGLPPPPASLWRMRHGDPGTHQNCAAFQPVLLMRRASYVKQ